MNGNFDRPRAGVRTLTPDDQPGGLVLLTPGGQIDAVGDLRDFSVLSLAAVLIQGRNPSIRGDLEDRGTDRLGQLIANREAHVRFAAVVDQTVRRAGGIRAHQDLQRLDVLGRDLRQRPVDHRDMIGGGVRAGVPGTQQTAERLARLIQVDLQRMNP